MKHFIPITKPHPYLFKDIKKNRERKNINASRLQLFTVSKKYFMFSNDSGILFELTAAAFQFVDKLQKDPSAVADYQVSHEWLLMNQHGLFLPPPVQEAEETKTVDTLNINISQCCNLSCKYCFANDGVYSGKPKYMDRLLLEKIILAFTSNLALTGNKGNIVLFGGEPLLTVDLIYAAADLLQKQTREKRLEITVDIFTNATLIDDDFIQFLVKNPNFRLLISLDGPPPINNNFRTSPSFGVAERVGQVIEKLSKSISMDRIVLRCTIADTEKNLIERIKYFVSLGVESIVMDAAFCMYNDYIPQHKDILCSIMTQLSDIADYLIRHPQIHVNLISEMTARLLTPDISRGYKASQCPAGTKYLAVDSDGYIFPCHFFVGNPDHSISHITNGLVQKDIPGMYGLRKSEYSKCKICRFSSLCEGFCPNKFQALGSHFDEWADTYCTFVKERIINSIYMLASCYHAHYPYDLPWKIFLHQ